MMTLLTTLSLVVFALPPQEPNDVLATFQLGGKPAAVTRTDVAVEMAFHQRRQELGLQACDVLVDAVLTRRAATAKHLMPTDEEVRKFWADLQAQLRAAGKKPEEFAAVRNTGETEWLRYLAIQMAQERLVRAELELDPKEQVSGDMLRLWQQEARKKATIEIDPDVLPIGTAAVIDGETIPMVELGTLLLRTSEEDERRKFITQFVYLRSIDAFAKEQGVEPSLRDIETAITERAKEAARDPRFHGLPFEQVLKTTTGMTLAGLKQSRVFRAKVLLEQLSEKLYPDATLRQDLEHDRQAILERVGPRRRISMIFVRAIDEPNALIPYDFPAAIKKLGEVKTRLQKDDFDIVARIESQEPMSKAQGGDLGWHTRKSPRLPESVLKTAFALAPNEVSEPVQDKDGCFLVKVTDVEPELTDDKLIERLREQRSQELSAKILADAKLEIAGDQDKQKEPK
jgi:hypothetical protein